jgi:hypothetical protein
MCSFTLKEKLFAGGGFVAVAAFAGLIGAATTAPVPAAAQQKAAPPNFSSNQYGWVRVGQGGPDFDAVPDTVPPVVNDPAHPFVGNGTRQQPTFRIADLSNPNLKPWVKEHMKKDNEEVLAGKIAFSARQSCLPAGVPGFMAYGGPTPLYFVQTPQEVWMIFEGDHQVRHVMMGVPHSEHPTPSWYGESVGHYEGDTLVIDTIAQNTKTVVDPYRTPHTEKLHVVERWKMTNDGKALESIFTVDDPDSFNQPWTGKRRYRRVDETMAEDVCAENNEHLFNYGIPVANRPDF